MGLEPNFQNWLTHTDQLEEWAKQLIFVAGSMYQQDLEQAKIVLDEYYSATPNN